MILGILQLKTIDPNIRFPEETLKWRQLENLKITQVKPLEGEYHISIILKLFKKRYQEYIIENILEKIYKVYKVETRPRWKNP